MTVPVRATTEGHYTVYNQATGNLVTGAAGVRRVIVNTTAASASQVIDSTGTTPTAANTILTIPASAAVGTIYVLNWRCNTGLSVVCGGAMTLNVAYDSGS